MPSFLGFMLLNLPGIYDEVTLSLHPNPNPNLNPNSNPNQPKDECAAGSAGDGVQDRTGAKELPTAPAAGRRRKFSLPSLRGRRAS